MAVGSIICVGRVMGRVQVATTCSRPVDDDAEGDTMHSESTSVQHARHVHTWRDVTVAASAVAALLSALVMAQPAGRTFPLTAATGLGLHNVDVAAATLDGKQGLRMTIAAAARRQIEAMTPQEREQAAAAGRFDEQLAVLEGVQFGNGTIEAEIAGAPAADAPAGARGFVGIAFRVQPDMRTYDAFYLRPTNGRADDQVRRNHSAQYISHPDWPWFRLRKETPEKYESYVDLVPGAWTRIRIEVRDTQARLYVHGQPQPTLIVNDLKTGAAATGGIALWIDAGTEAHFRNLTVTPAGQPAPQR
jgi:hypothetical protein